MPVQHWNTRYSSGCITLEIRVLGALQLSGKMFFLPSGCVITDVPPFLPPPPSPPSPPSPLLPPAPLLVSWKFKNLSMFQPRRHPQSGQTLRLTQKCQQKTSQKAGGREGDKGGVYWSTPYLLSGLQNLCIGGNVPCKSFVCECGRGIHILAS